MKYQIGDRVRVSWIGEYATEDAHNTITGILTIIPDESLYRIDDGSRDGYYGEEELEAHGA